MCEKEVCNFHEFYTPGVLVGLSFSVNLKKNCRINFQCRRKNVIMVVYGKSDCGPCPVSGAPLVKNLQPDYDFSSQVASSYTNTPNSPNLG